MIEPPTFPSITLPPQVIPEPLRLPQPILNVPQADVPAYQPMVAPPDQLVPPVGVPREGEEGPAKDKPKDVLPEVNRVTIPGTDIKIPVPKEEIVVTAATTAAISVVATLTATSLFNYLVKLLKPVFMQAVKRVQKKLNGNSETKEPSA